MIARILLGTFGVVYGISFLVVRERWTRFFKRFGPQKAPSWTALIFPYFAFAMLMLWSIIMFTGAFGAI